MVSGCASLCLLACAKPPALIEPFLQPCRIEGRYGSMAALLDDATSTAHDLIAFAGHAEDAVRRCNADKAAALRLLDGETP